MSQYNQTIIHTLMQGHMTKMTHFATTTLQIWNQASPEDYVPYLRLNCQIMHKSCRRYSGTFCGNYAEVYSKPKLAIMSIFGKSPGVEIGKQQIMSLINFLLYIFPLLVFQLTQEYYMYLNLNQDLDLFIFLVYLYLYYVSQFDQESQS